MSTGKSIPFSVCMSVYKNDNADDFLTALRSVTLRQTMPPAELILVIDGPISEQLEHTIEVFSKEYTSLTLIRFAENKGHAAARQAGIDASHYNMFAIMDSDDIACPDRFEKELAFMLKHPNIDVVGGQIEEFDTNEENIVSRRIVPQTDEDIKSYLKYRCPMNFMTIMARKEAVMKVGGVIDWFCEEDYFLWIRMAQNNCIFANLPTILVSVRVSDALYSRRGGWRYFKSERAIQKYMLQHHMITWPQYCFNVIGRFIIQVCIHNKFRGFLYKKLLRQ